MRVKKIVVEDFTNYKEPCMFICTISCSGKCCAEAKIPLSVCQNDGWRKRAAVEMSDDDIIQRYTENSITSAICFGGLEPFEQFDELFDFVAKLRTEYRCNDTVVIYTGYNLSEIMYEVDAIKKFENIIIKFGRYVPNQQKHFDEVLGVYLASGNQYAEKIS